MEVATNATLMYSNGLESAIALTAHTRTRGGYDANGDGYTELARLRNTAIGTDASFVLSNGTLHTSFAFINEERRGVIFSIYHQTVPIKLNIAYTTFCFSRRATLRTSASIAGNSTLQPMQRREFTTPVSIMLTVGGEHAACMELSEGKEHSTCH